MLYTGGAAAKTKVHQETQVTGVLWLQRLKPLRCLQVPADISAREIPHQVKRLAEVRKTPFLAINRNLIKRKFEQFQKAIPDARVFYAIKTNSHKRIVQMLHSCGSGFEISSEDELDLLSRRGVPSQKIISSNPLKSISFIRAAHNAGVEHFAFDSREEIGKLAEFAHGSKVYVRLVVSNEGSAWPLSKKFGVETEQAVELLAEAASNSLVPYGITFHVGSQCTDASSWVNAIEKSKVVWDMAKTKGLDLRMLNIGGGFPIEYTSASVPTVDLIAEKMLKSLKRTFPDGVEIFAEPGRTFVGEAGILVSTVIAKARRNGENWLYLDVGVFNGLFESTGGIQYSMITDRGGSLSKWVVAGPSCDSVDVIATEMDLPELEIGDTVYILSAGAYTTAYASRFNGFPIPKTYLV